MIWEDACRTLGVLETATPAEIKEQYLYKVQLLHPDKTLDKPDKIRQKAEEELIGINEAYKFLSEDRNNPRNPPKLEIAPRAVRFAEVGLNQKKETTIEIKSAGGPYTNCWIDNSPASWLAVTSVKATSSEALPLLVTIEVQGMPAVIQPERCQILIRLKNEKTGLMTEDAINVEIIPLHLIARLKIQGRKIKFQKVPLDTVRSYVLEFGNRGPEILHGYIATNAPWLSASLSEIVLPKKAMSRCTISVDTTNLSSGLRDVGLINVCTNGGEAVIPVELTTVGQRQSRPASASSYPGGQGQGQKAYGSMYAATPVTRVRRKSGGFWFFKFILIFALIFGVGLACIYYFLDDPDWGNILSWWGAIAFVVSLLLSLVRG
ncbi:MAG: J domain-containing protein [Dehalococcoidia bacterium]|nr:J domain-containing protein [Dehalococcoidia bacterium]